MRRDDKEATERDRQAPWLANCQGFEPCMGGGSHMSSCVFKYIENILFRIGAKKLTTLPPNFNGEGAGVPNVKKGDDN